MNERPLHVVLRNNLVELLLDQSNVLVDLFGAPAEPGASHHTAIDGRANIEMGFVGVLEGGRIGRPGRCANGKQCRHQPSGVFVWI
jgi:hypothetical protein